MSDRSISVAISRMAGTHGKDYVFYVNAEVESVDMSNRTCNCIVTEGDTEYSLPSVKLMPVIDDGMIIEPKVGSTVRVLYSTFKESFIVQYSEIENITIIAKTKIVFQGGEFGGLVKINDLTTKLNNLVDEVNTLTKRVNEHKHTYNAYPAVPTLTTTSTKVVSVPDLPIADVTEFNKDDYENISITHGN